ncbi:MAG: hypothetical protein HY241_00535 [Actinobacteria bacterium]|nr:hypothetical protein [Actinomycetota bacterium]
MTELKDTLVATVVKWSGREARALRQARRMSVRQFAAHLGFNDAAVSNWERRGEDARLRYQTQQILDTDLARAPQDVRDRFELVKRQQDAETTHAHADLGSGSSTRTRTLLDAMRAQIGSGLRYLPPVGATQGLAAFLESSSRVYVVKGPPGSGKTRLTYHLADELANDVDVQLLSVDSWDLPTLDLAATILRYASIPQGIDPLLTLEAAGVALRRSCLVVVDGINSQEQLNQVGRHIDGILRQVPPDALRFMLVVRTPPDVELATFPVLAASIFMPQPVHAGGASFVLMANIKQNRILEYSRVGVALSYGHRG